MNNLCTDIGYRSLHKHGEQLCGDHIDIIEQEDGTKIIVLADGLGSGVKASILSTLTSKIISTMMAEGISLEECVSTIAATLPVCSVRGVAYSTFTIMKVSPNNIAEIIEYDNPSIIFIRDGQNIELEKVVTMHENKKIYKSKVELEENDIFIMMSDGCIYAGVGKTLNFGWTRKEIIDYMSPLTLAGYTAKTLTTILLDECNRLYAEQPGDDTTVCTVRIRKREAVNLLFGPPSNPSDANKMMSLFFSKGGKHIICGGTTSSIAAKYLGNPIIPSTKYYDPKIPPTAELDGADLVTEGVITINKVLEYALDYLEDNKSYTNWCFKKDGASMISRILFEEATDINFFVGRAINPAHQNPNLPINFSIKMQLASKLTEALKKMGKNIKVQYF